MARRDSVVLFIVLLIVRDIICGPGRESLATTFSFEVFLKNLKFVFLAFLTC